MTIQKILIYLFNKFDFGFDIEIKNFDNIKRIINSKYNKKIDISNFTINFNIDDVYINKKINNMLMQYGIVVIRDYYKNKNSINSIAFNINKFLKENKNSIVKKLISIAEIKSINNELKIVQREYYANNKKSSENNDEGMIEIFNVDKLSINILDTCNFINSDIILNLINNMGSNLKITNHNLYINESVNKTRYLHVDSLIPEFKVFTYLTDVTDRSYGPYSYVPFSHKNSLINMFNMFINWFFMRTYIVTTSTLCDNNRAIEIYGNIGDIIISDQRGIHGGVPQKVGRNRIVLVSTIK